jgi:hypothetical protein
MAHFLLRSPAAWALIVAFAVASIDVPAAEPALPCQPGTSVNYPSPGATPKVETWRQGDLSTWTPPACSGWSQVDSSFLVVVTGSFRSAASIDAIAQKLGAVSALPHVRYWSVTDKDWRPLVINASALADADKKDKRPDFAPQEMTEGATHFTLEHDARSGDVVDRLTILQRTDERIALSTENLTPIRLFLLPVIESHGLQSFEYVEKTGPDLWHVTLATRVIAGRALVKDHESSYINRAVALFRYLAGIPTDQEPPAQR